MAKRQGTQRDGENVTVAEHYELVEELRDSQPVTLAAACEYIEALGHVVLDLQAQLATEVRTKRLVVLDDEDGSERVVVEANAIQAHVKVMSRDGESSVRVYAVSDEDEPQVIGVDLCGHGNHFAQYQAHEVTDEKRSKAAQLIGHNEWRAELALAQPNDSAGMVLDYKGLHLEQPRLRDEADAYLERAQVIKATRERKGW